MSGPDEFDVIARLLRPLAAGAPEALNLEDDAAVIPSRPGYDLVVTKDAMVAGVHFLPDCPLDLVARKLLRVNLSDLAAKGAEPYGYFLAMAWPDGSGWPDREAFARGLAIEQDAFGLKLFGGDTVSTPGPLTVSATLLGWTPSGRMIRRSGAQAGDILQVSGTIGDGCLGLAVAKGGGEGIADQHRAYLLDRFNLPLPRLDLDITAATACADISDGLVADAGHIASASMVALEIDLDRAPLSAAAAAWLSAQSDRENALSYLVTGGDDYELLATAPTLLPGFTAIGFVSEGEGVTTRLDGAPVHFARTGYRHGNDD